MLKELQKYFVYGYLDDTDDPDMFRANGKRIPIGQKKKSSDATKLAVPEDLCNIPTEQDQMPQDDCNGTGIACELPLSSVAAPAQNVKPTDTSGFNHQSYYNRAMITIVDTAEAAWLDADIDNAGWNNYLSTKTPPEKYRHYKDMEAVINRLWGNQDPESIARFKEAVDETVAFMVEAAKKFAEDNH
ncbi:MAG: hypothetical protein M0024_10510 [Nitrospiraceae bacterium]|nr:hypothetical protein [Nitrospiraceae bacterium]